MQSNPRLHGLSPSALQQVLAGHMRITLSDSDFLRALAAHRCILVPPFVVRTSALGTVDQLTPLVYDADGNLDKPRLLLNVARALGKSSQLTQFPLESRFSI